jgi:hypothetical protein
VQEGSWVLRHEARGFDTAGIFREVEKVSSGKTVLLQIVLRFEMLEHTTYEVAVEDYTNQLLLFVYYVNGPR